MTIPKGRAYWKKAYWGLYDDQEELLKTNANCVETINALRSRLTGKGEAMTFKEAKEKLKALASGNYHSVSYELTEYSGGDLRAECRVYLYQGQHHTGATWEEAFAKLDLVLNGIAVDEAEMP